MTPTLPALEPVGIVHSCFHQKFGIPRQAGLAASATAELELLGDYSQPEAVRGLEDCSHLWLVFVFSEHLGRGWSPLVRPPRSGGSKRGVFATRSPFRPNALGLSVVRLEGLRQVAGGMRLDLSGIDLLDGTPVVDIKPYLPWADALPEASCTYAPGSQQLDLPLVFSAAADQALACHPRGTQLRCLIREVLLCDPRPSQLRTSQREFAVALLDTNVRWRFTEQQIQVIVVEPLASAPVAGAGDSAGD